MADENILPPAGGPTLSRRVAAGAAWAQVSRLAEFASSLALSLVLIRALGPNRYGQYSFIVNVATVGAVFLSLGFPDTVMRFVSIHLALDEVAQIRFLVRRLVVTRALVYGAGIVLLFALHDAATSLHLPLIDRYWPAIAVLLVSQGAIEFSTSYAYARLQSRSVAVARTIGQVVALGFFAAVALLGLTDVFTASITVAISYLSASALLFFRGLGEVLLRGDASPTPLRPLAGFAAAAWATTLATIGLAGQIDVILLGALRQNAVQIAFYSVATLVFVKLNTLLSGWAGTATSSFADVHTRRGTEASRRLFNVYLRISIMLSLLVYPPIILAADQVTRLAFGPSYAPAAQLMVVYGCLWLGSAILAAGIPMSALLAFGMQRQAFAIRAGCGALNIVLDVVLIPPLGALGAILATGAANLIAHVADFAIAAGRIQARYPWAFAARVGAASAVAAVPALLIHFQGLVGSLLAAILYLVLFGVGLLLLKPLGPGEVELAGRLSPRLASLVGRIAAGANRTARGPGP
jgi:O-antigen/teichoic acid export membrane protein